MLPDSKQALNSIASMHTMLKNVVYSLTYIMFYLFKQPCQPQWHVLVTTMALQMKAK